MVKRQLDATSREALINSPEAIERRRLRKEARERKEAEEKAARDAGIAERAAELQAWKSCGQQMMQGIDRQIERWTHPREPN